MSSEKEEQEAGEGQEIKEYYDDNILLKEVESWKDFEYALRNPNSSLFNKMLKECLESEEYAEAFKTKRPQFFAEDLPLCLYYLQE